MKFIRIRLDSPLETMTSSKKYIVPISKKNWTIITSIRELEKHREFLYEF